MAIDALNAICPYYTMYPLKFPMGILKRHGKIGNWVLDPFCGRGTTNFAARLLGMPSYGIDSSPVAAALAKAKLLSAHPEEIIECAKYFTLNVQNAEVPEGEFWTLAFAKGTLFQLCQLRKGLLEASPTPVTELLKAIILGALHGPTPKGQPSYFSNQSPRTFAPKPRYAVKFWQEHKLNPPAVDILDVISIRANRYLTQRPPCLAGKILQMDSRDPSIYDEIPSPSLIITSPPYFGMRTYLQDQWLRMWFLGGTDHVSYRNPPTQLGHSGAISFAAQIGQVWSNTRRIASEDTRLVIRFGGIHDRAADPMDVIRMSLQNTGWVISTAKAVPDSDTGKRQVRQFVETPKTGITEYDVYCRPV